MVSLSVLNPTSEWVAHELRCEARERGYVCKRAGVESLFRDRKQAMETICREFSIEHLSLRALPDMILRSPAGTFLVEAKDGTSTTPNIALELHQLLFLRRMGGDTWYCIGWPDRLRRKLDAWMVQAKNLDPARILIPDRTQTWPADLKVLMREWMAAEGWQGLWERHSSTHGSDDPFALIPKAALEGIGGAVSLEEWLDARRADGYTQKFRIGWEGKDEASQVWGHMPPPGGWEVRRTG